MENEHRHDRCVDGSGVISEAPEGEYGNIINRVAVIECIVRERRTFAAANYSEPELQSC